MTKINIKKTKSIELNNLTAYLSGAIIGDGHISDSTKSKKDLSQDYRVIIDISDKDYLIHLSKLIKSFVVTKSKPKKSKIKGKRKERLYFQFRNKAFFNFLINLGIPKGSKSNIVFVPSKIKEADLDIKKSFVAGIFDTDGSFRSDTLGFTSASQKLIIDLSVILKELKIKHYLDCWKNNKYNRTYFGIKIIKKEIVKFLNTLPLQNKEKLQRICGRSGEQVLLVSARKLADVTEAES